MKTKLLSLCVLVVAMLLCGGCPPRPGTESNYAPPAIAPPQPPVAQAASTGTSQADKKLNGPRGRYSVYWSNQNWNTYCETDAITTLTDGRIRFVVVSSTTGEDPGDIVTIRGNYETVDSGPVPKSPALSSAPSPTGPEGN